MKVLTLTRLITVMVALLILSLGSISLMAKPVSPADAVKAAQSWLKTDPAFRGADLGNARIGSFDGRGFRPLNSDRSDLTHIYLVSFEHGYVLLSGDDESLPVLAYSTESAFPYGELPDNITNWLSIYERQISEIVTNGISLPEYQQRWTELISGYVNTSSRTERSVAALLKTNWDQGWPYNELCPADEAGPGGHVYAGCVATAMAMVMKYWNHPTTGVGSNSYFAYGYGYQSANFGATTYDWDAMPNSVGSSNLAVARLLYHLGVSVDMDYAPDGSGAQSYDAADAMAYNFRYPNAEIRDRSSYSDASWSSMLTAQIDNGSPMYYSGSGSGGGHAFVLDGYDTAGYFHFNFGWSGSGNGYYYTNSLNPGGTPFNDWQSVIVNSIPENYSIANTRVKMRCDNATAGNALNVTVSTNPLLGSWNVNHYQFNMLYDQQNMSFDGATIANTISVNGTVSVTETEPGLLSVVWNGTGNLFGGGDLISLSFTPYDAGEFLFDIGSMMYNSYPVNNIQYLMANVVAPVANLAETQITMQNVMHLGYQLIGTTEVRSTYLLPSWDVTHYQFNLNYNPTKLEYIGIETSGTLSEGLSPTAVVNTPGIVSISCDTQSAMVGSGALLKPMFRAIGNGTGLSVTQVSPTAFFLNTTAITALGSANFILSASTAVQDELAPALKLSIYPNPVQESARFAFSAKTDAPAHLGIYNLRGQMVRQLEQNAKEEILWDGRDQDGHKLPTGIYFVEWSLAKQSGKAKLLIIR